MNNRIDEARLSEFESECNKKNEGTLSTILSERSEKTVLFVFRKPWSEFNENRSTSRWYLHVRPVVCLINQIENKNFRRDGTGQSEAKICLRDIFDCVYFETLDIYFLFYREKSERKN